MPVAVIKSSSMGKDLAMQEKAIEVGISAVEECNTENEMATYIKKAFEKEYGHM